MNRYIEHIISDLVRDTRIDYEKNFIYLPYFPPHLSPTYLSFISLFPSSYFFSDYCKERYGLTKEEIDYVWDVYKIIIKDKIINNE